jgi:hypothetical protein
MTGFQPKRKILNLRFPDEEDELHRLEARVASVSFGEYTEIGRLIAESSGITSAAADASDKINVAFATALQSWNYHDPATGEPLSPDLAGIRQADPQHVLRLIATWYTEMVRPPGTLKTPSPNGSSPGPSEEATLGLANLSSSQPS